LCRRRRGDGEVQLSSEVQHSAEVVQRSVDCAGWCRVGAELLVQSWCTWCRGVEWCRVSAEVVVLQVIVWVQRFWRGSPVEV
jgi:hypothetical protein